MYLDILWRRIWIIALIVGVVVIYAGYQYYTTHKAGTTSTNYRNSITVRIGIQEEAGNQNQHFSDYTATNDTLADEFVSSPIVTSPAFGSLISQQIQSDMPLIDQQYKTQPDLGNWQNAQAISSALTLSRTHGLVTFSISWNTDAGAWAIAQAAGEVSVAHITDFSDYEIRTASATTTDANQPLVAAKVVSPATTHSTAVSNTSTPASRTTTLLLLIIIALIIAIALAFLVEYLDERIRRPEEVVQLLQLPIYAEIPRAPAAGQSSSPPSKA
jgi:capsular polysaccharide biosynthesis protein